MKFKHQLLKTTPVVFFFALPFLGMAQAPPGIGEFYEASGEMHRWYFSLSDMVLVLGAISGILGGLRVYANWQSGKHHIDAQSWAGSFPACSYRSSGRRSKPCSGCIKQPFQFLFTF